MLHHFHTTTVTLNNFYLLFLYNLLFYALSISLIHFSLSLAFFYMIQTLLNLNPYNRALPTSIHTQKHYTYCLYHVYFLSVSHLVPLHYRTDVRLYQYTNYHHYTYKNRLYFS